MSVWFRRSRATVAFESFVPARARSLPRGAHAATGAHACTGTIDWLKTVGCRSGREQGVPIVEPLPDAPCLAGLLAGQARRRQDDDVRAHAQALFELSPHGRRD